MKVKGIETNAFGVLLGRVLEFICEDKNAKGETLFKKLQHLANEGDIPKKLISVANGLREFRNIGAHASLGEIPASAVPILEKLCLAIIDYVYTAPHIANQAEEMLQRLKR
jgi:hypothetical protein